MTTLETLISARKKIDAPYKWIQGVYSGAGACCMAGALYLTLAGNEPIAAATNALRDVIDDTLVHFNDTPGRTHSEVLAAFDVAIAKLEKAA